MTQTHLKKLVEAPWFAKIIMILIIINAPHSGNGDIPRSSRQIWHALLKAIDHAILWVFVAEIALKLAAYRLAFFRDPWVFF